MTISLIVIHHQNASSWTQVAGDSSLNSVEDVTGVFRLKRQGYRKGTALPDFTANVDPASHCPYQPVRNCETEPGTFDPGLAVDALKRLKDAVQIRRRDTAAGVLNVEAQ